MVKIKTSGVNVAGILGIVVVIIGIAVYTLLPRDSFPGSDVISSDQERRAITDDSRQPLVEERIEEVVVTGQYRDFFQGDLEEVASQKRVVLFFDGRNCQTCVLLHENIRNNIQNIPEDVIIFRVPFSSSLELRNQYQVREPGVLVYIDNSTNEIIRTWKNSITLDAILAVVR